MCAEATEDALWPLGEFEQLEFQVNNTEESLVGQYGHWQQPESEKLAVGDSSRFLEIKDYLDIYSANVNPRMTQLAKGHILSMLRENSVVTVNTISKVSVPEEVDYEHTYPVIRRIADPRDWVAPRDRIIFEPALDKPSLRYTYHPNQFKPLDVTITIEARQRWRWTLKADREVSRYEVCRNDNSDFIPVLDTTRFGPGDRFIIFHYFHDDVRREHPARIFYKYEGDYIRFHCVSIPLKLLSSLVGTVEDTD